MTLTGKDLRNARYIYGYTQESLAEALGVSRQTVQRDELSEQLDLNALARYKLKLGFDIERIRDFIDVERARQRHYLKLNPEYVNL